MPEFDYQGRNRNGELTRGVIEAPNQDVAATQLFDKGIIPIKIALQDKEFDWRRLINLVIVEKHIDRQELIMFCRQMYTLYKAGVPIILAVTRLTETARSEMMRDTLKQVLKDLEAGRTIAQAMSIHPRVFPKLLVNIVEVGESSGQLDEVFLNLSHYFELEESTIKRIKSATRYPMIVIFAIVIAMVILNMFVIPVFARLFATNHAALPWATKLLLGISDFMVSYWGYLLFTVVMIVISLRMYLKTDAGQYWWDKKKLRLPVIGSVLEKSLFARFARTFALIIRTDISLPRGIELVASASGNNYMQEKILMMRGSIEKGESLVKAAVNTHMFSPLVLQMLTVGEETGAIDTMLEQVAEFYEREVDFELKRFGDAIEPILLVIIGAMVLVLALGIFMPMWKMNSVLMGKK